MMKQQVIKLIISIALPLLVGAVAGMFTAKAVPEWYAGLNRPAFSPPNWLFGPVWTTLYLVMGISVFLVWKQSPSDDRNISLIVFLVQLILNFAWSFLFFYFKLIGIALVEIVLLWFTIIIMIIQFYKVLPIAAYINIPYLLWVSFATVLNAAYYLLNKN
jgi:translocator protein